MGWGAFVLSELRSPPTSRNEVASGEMHRFRAALAMGAGKRLLRKSNGKWTEICQAVRALPSWVPRPPHPAAGDAGAAGVSLPAARAGVFR